MSEREGESERAGGGIMRRLKYTQSLRAKSVIHMCKYMAGAKEFVFFGVYWDKRNKTLLMCKEKAALIRKSIYTYI